MIRKTLLIPLTLLLAASPSLFAQTNSTVPVPSQFAAAHTIFLAPAGVSVPNNEDYVAAIYTDTYNMLSTLGPYKMVTQPSAADMSVEASIITKIDFNYLRLSFYDTKTHTLLWVIDSPLIGVFNAKTAAATESRAGDDLRDLITGVVPISPATKKKAQKQ